MAAMCAGMAFLTRFIGVTVIVAGSLLLLIRPHKSLAARIRNFIAYAVVAAVPVGAWVVACFLCQDSPFRSRWPSGEGGGRWGHNLCVTAGEFTEWGIGRFGSGHLGKLCFPYHAVFDLTPRDSVCVLQFGLLLVFALSATYSLCRIRGGARVEQRAALAPPVTFALTYTLVLFTVLHSSGIKVEIRCLAPPYISLLFVATIALDAYYHRVTSKGAVNLSSLALITSLFLWTFQQIYVNCKDINSWLAHGGPWMGEEFSQRHLYTTQYWTTSESIQYIKSDDVEGRLRTTNASALGRLTGIPTTPLPVRLPDRVTDWPTDQLTPGTVLVWHWAQEKHLVDYAYGPEELLDALPLLGVDRVFSDGIVLKIGVAGSNGRDPSPPIILDTLLQKTIQIISAYYDVHLHSTQNRLIYRKKQCSENGTSGPVLLRVFAVNDFDLPSCCAPGRCRST